MIKRWLPWEGLGHEIVAHGGVLYIGGVVAEDTSLDMAGQADDVLRQLAKLLTAGGSSIAPCRSASNPNPPYCLT
jgi:enamine deaminase RidA (YjgF/YER057c/UK114 family)